MDQANEANAAISSRSARAVGSARAVLGLLMQPRDLGHPQACDFLAGNPQEMALPAYIDAVRRAVVPDSAAYYRYGPPWPGAIAAVTAALGKRLGLELDARDVFLTRGAASGLALLLEVLVDPGDEVMMMSPPWFFYESMVLQVSGIPVKVPVTDGFDLDLNAIERAITPRTRAIIVNTPHNPSGRIYPEDQLRDLAAILERASARNGRRLYLLSDEAYARILFDNRPMITPGKYYPATFMIHTYSKSLLAPSQRAGYLAMSPAMPDREQLRLPLLFGSIRAAPDTTMQHAMPELEELMIDLPPLERRRDHVVAELRRCGYTVGSPEGAFYLFPQTPTRDAHTFCEWLAQRRVYALPGAAFEREGYFRLSLTATDAMVERALPILAEAARTFTASRAGR